MSKEVIRETSEWRPFSDLNLVQRNISGLGYNKDYIEEHGLNDTKIFHCTNMVTGVMCYFEPLEVQIVDNEVFWRYNENLVHMKAPEKFETQFGTFYNHNHGEFTSWLGKDNYHGLLEKEEINSLFGRADFFVEGNYCDMFDCGEYSYAISNLMHLGLGTFKIIRINKKLEAVAIYKNYHNNKHTRLEYEGRFQNTEGYVVIASGSRELENDGDRRKYQDITILFQISGSGKCIKSCEWDFSISSANSMAVKGDYVYFGQNKMITRLNIQSGETVFFTNKTDEEIAALVNIWR